MQRAEQRSWAPVEALDTPYRRAHQEWDRRMGSALAHARNWRLATFGSLLLVALATLGLVYLGAQPKTVPHIIEVDRLGAAHYVGPAGQTARDYRPSEASLRYHLRRFIDDVRAVSSDPAVVKRNW